jgi:type I restriction enzyme S subunit
MSGIELQMGYKQTELGVIPEAWEQLEIGDTNPFVTSGSRGWARYYSEFGDPFIRITNMSRDVIKLDLDDLKKVKLPQGLSEAKRTQLQKGDVLPESVSHVTPRPGSGPFMGSTADCAGDL